MSNDYANLMMENVSLREECDLWKRSAQQLARDAEKHWAELADVTSEYNRCVEDVHAAREELERLRAELAACREDAERYRWLRYPRMGWDIVRKTDGELLCAEYLDGIELDAAIDAARKGEGA